MKEALKELVLSTILSIFVIGVVLLTVIDWSM